MYSFLTPDQDPLPFSEEMLLEFEDRYNFCLPDALKDFYRTCNGMSMVHTPLVVDGRTYVVDRFIPLFTGNMSADHILDLYSMGNLIPDTYFPLALSDTGDDFFLDTNTGSIVLLPLERPSKKKEIADDIESFFTMLENAQGTHCDTADQALSRRIRKNRRTK